MTKIYIAAYKEFGNYKTLKKVCDYFLSRLDKSNVLFYVSTGERGDNTCMKYIRENGYKYIDWLPIKKGVNRSEEKLKAIKNCDHSILVTNGSSVGIGIAINHSCRNIKGKTVVVRTQSDDVIIAQPIKGKERIIKKIKEL